MNGHRPRKPARARAVGVDRDADAASSTAARARPPLRKASDALAERLPNAERRTLYGQSHNLSRKVRGPCSRSSWLILAGTPDPARARGGAERRRGRRFRHLVEPHRRDSTRTATACSAPLHDAEDALQGALLRAWRGSAAFEAGRRSARGSTRSRRTRASTRSRSGRSASCISTGPRGSRPTARARRS